MENISINVLLDYLYNRFAVTFIWCFFGSMAREVFIPTKKKNKVIDPKRIIISTVFSTVLMCTVADYIELTISAYILLNIICGMWGMIIVQLAVNENFVTKLLLKLVERIPSPVLKDTTETITDEIKGCSDDEEDKSQNKEKKNKKETPEK